MSFRKRLTALIAAVFILGGGALLGVQYVLVQRLLEQRVDEQTVARPVDVTAVPGAPSVRETVPGAPFVGCPEATVPDRVVTADDAVWLVCLDGDGQAVERFLLPTDATPEQQAEVLSRIVYETTTRTTTRISDEVLHTLVVWSLVIFAAFAAAAVGVAWWLSGRSLGRIARITAATRGISHDDLDRRLDLPGPADEIKELGDTIDSMLDRIEDAFTRQDRFIAGASHELRTPLTTTRTLLEIPLEQGRFPSDVEPSVRAALDANGRSERLVTALLTLARSRHACSGATTDLTALTEELLAEKADDAAARGLRVSVQRSCDSGRCALSAQDDRGEGAEAGVPAALGPDLALLAVGNLLDNAIRHNVDGGLVAVGTGSDAQTTWVEVSNDGADLTATDVEALKEPFHRGEASRLAGEGLGLGLALVETVARSAGGRLELTTRTQGGLTARLTVRSAAV